MTPIDILIRAKQEGLEKAARDFDALGNSAQKAGDAISASGRKAAAGTESIGKSASATRGELRNLAGEGTQLFASIVSGSSQASASMQALTTGITGIGTALAVGSGIGIAIAAVSAGIGFLISKMKEAEAEAEAMRKAFEAPFEEARKSIEALSKIDPLEKFAQSIPMSTAAMREFAASSREAATQVLGLVNISQALADTQAKLATATKNLANDLRAGMGEQDVQIIADRQAIADLEEAVARLTGAQTKMGQAISGATSAVTGQYDALNKLRGSLFYAAQYTEDLEQGGMAANKAIKATADTMATAAPSIDKYAQAAAKSASILQGAIAKAMTPTSVTGQDLIDTQLGKYKDKWDEFARQADAVATGTDPAQFKGMEEALARLGMTAEQAAAGFRDFSLFADPKNFELVNWGPITESVEQQLKSMAGKAALTSEALKQVWANLSPSAKANLAKAGIESEEDALTALLDPLGKANKEAGEYKGTLNTIPKDITTLTAMKWDEAKTAIDEFEDYIKEHVFKYGTISITFEGETVAPASGGGGGTPAFAAGGYIPAGMAGIVGEKGPELFVPHSSGTIIPNHELKDLDLSGILSGGQSAVEQFIMSGAVGGLLKAGYAIPSEFLNMSTQVLQLVLNQALGYRMSHAAVDSLWGQLHGEGSSNTTNNDMFHGATINVYPSNYNNFVDQMAHVVRTKSAQGAH